MEEYTAETAVETVDMDDLPDGDHLDADSDVIVFKRSHFYAVLVPTAFVLGLGVGFLFWGRDTGAPAGSAVGSPSSAQTAGEASSSSQAAASGSSQSAASAGQGEVIRYDVPIDDDPVLGPENAPITIIEFSDYECPFCRKFHEETFQRLLVSYPEQIRFVYRDFPLSSIHENAIGAAEAANCARDQNVFWEFHDQLFSMQYGLGREAYLQYAQDLGIDLAVFDQCIEDRVHQAEVEADFEFAARLGVRSTPTFFINGIALVGAQPYEVFQQVIDQELAGEIP